MTDNSSIGLYLHIPFCAKKCAYCDFYSTFLNRELLKDYSLALIKDIKKWGGQINRPISSLYIGGGTPSLLLEDLPNVTNAVFENFCVEKNAEITLEINPSNDIEKVLFNAKKTGVNRISIGVQSGDDEELKLLGRTHSANDAKIAVELARKQGFNNISLDLMLGLPHSNLSSLEKSLDFITELNPEHISAYILKIEPNTLFYKTKENLCLPDDDEQAKQYLFMCEYLKSKGYRHYEISNFCKDEMFSRHNNLYWQCKEYLGLGASAHSFLSGKRFYYPCDIKAYISGTEPLFDSYGGDESEYIMLRLRLDEGVNFAQFEQKFGKKIPDALIKKAKLLEKSGLVTTDNSHISLTDEGMLLSNSIINSLLEAF